MRSSPALRVGRRRGGPPGLVQQAQDAADVARVGLPGRGEPQAAAVRLEQRHAQGLLQRGEGGGDRRLGHHQVLGGGAHRAGLRHGEEGAKLVQRHGALPGWSLTFCLTIAEYPQPYAQ